MRDDTEKYIKRLNKFSKEQIIRAISESHFSYFILDGLITDLEYQAQQDLLSKHSSAIDAERAAAQACMDWRREMCDRYGNGGNCKLKDIPNDEIKRGAKLELKWKEAQAKERAFDKRVNKALGIGGEKT